MTVDTPERDLSDDKVESIRRIMNADGGEDALPYVSRWEYVGTFHADDIPHRVLRNHAGRPPPDDDAGGV